MFTVALIGPDGAGKTTISRQLEHSLPRPVKYVYMGVSAASSNHMLPTTRLIYNFKRALGAPPDTAGPADPNKIRPRPKNPLKRLLLDVKTGLSLTNRIAEEWYRQCVIWYFQRRGFIVLFDRHFFSDYYRYDIADTGQPKPLSRRIHGFMLKNIYPKPNLVIYLDAPSEVLFARKGEGSLAILEERRKDYMEMGKLLPHFQTVDASQPQEKVVQDVTQMIWDFYRKSTGNQTTEMKHAERE
jgi:thymidylate kinase